MFWRGLLEQNNWNDEGIAKCILISSTSQHILVWTFWLYCSIHRREETLNRLFLYTSYQQEMHVDAEKYIDSDPLIDIYMRWHMYMTLKIFGK